MGVVYNARSAYVSTTRKLGFLCREVVDRQSTIKGGYKYALLHETWKAVRRNLLHIRMDRHSSHLRTTQQSGARYFQSCGSNSLQRNVDMGKRCSLLAAWVGSLRLPTEVRSFGVAFRPAAVRGAGARDRCNHSPLTPDSPWRVDVSDLSAAGALLAGSTSSADTAPPFGAMIGDKVASAIVNSPFYPLLIQQAKGTMKKSAETVGVDWDGEVARFRAAQDWDAALNDLLESSSVEPPEYYKRPFHAYSDGNLCWEAAWEQHLASIAVGVRNFPNEGGRGEYLLRKAYEGQMQRLGVEVEEGGLVVDLGCGSGTSTRYLAEQFPNAGQVVGFDLSPHMVVTGRFMNMEDEEADRRVDVRYGDAARTGLPDSSASLVSLCLVVHELPTEGRKAILAEANRILRPGGSLSIMEMDPSAPGYVKLRNNPMLFSILRSTEPYLDVYFADAGNIDTDLQEAGFSLVQRSMATGRHMTVVAVKGAGEGREGSFDLRGTDDEREKADTHLPSHNANVWIRNPIKRNSSSK